jgi:hypothetical protein
MLSFPLYFCLCVVFVSYCLRSGVTVVRQIQLRVQRVHAHAPAICASLNRNVNTARRNHAPQLPRAAF